MNASHLLIRRLPDVYMGPDGLTVAMPDISAAKLPTNYEAVKKALAQLERIDECKEWANKAEALVSYAKQAKDDMLRKQAARIHARAIRRCGELLKEINVDLRGRPRKNSVGVHTNRTRSATHAGLSRNQKVTCLRVASVVESEFERQVESENPPTVTALANQGRKPRKDPVRMKAKISISAEKIVAQIRRFAEFVQEHDPVEVASSIPTDQIISARANIISIDAWCKRFIASLPCTPAQFRVAPDGE